MRATKHPYTEFGLEITMFCAAHAITKKQLAEMAGVPYDTLLQCIKNRTAGHEAIPKLTSAMRAYELKEA